MTMEQTETVKITIRAIKDCLGDATTPIELAHAYADLREECDRQLEVCMTSMTSEEEQP